MPNPDTALLVIDVQESFRQEPYWSDRPEFFDNLQKLVASAKDRSIPIVQIFHVEAQRARMLAATQKRNFAKLWAASPRP